MIRRRHALARGTASIRQRSKKALAVLPERARAVDRAWNRDRGQCRARELVPEIECGGRLDPHEVIPRSAWAAGILDVDNIVIICRHHHDWVHRFPQEAHTRGLRRWAHERKPAILEPFEPVDAAEGVRCEECGEPWTNVVGGQCSRCGNRTWDRFL